MHSSNKNSSYKEKFILKRSLIFLMAAASGIGVANIYYLQPLLSEVSRDFQVSQVSMGAVAMLTQIGYAFGLLFFVPIGDMKERRSFIVLMALSVAGSLLLMSLSFNIVMFSVASLIIGLTAVVPQLIVPFAANLSDPQSTGKVVGTVMSGLYAGILVSRTFSGIIGSNFGWRTVYVSAALLMVVLAMLLKKFLPLSFPTSGLGYLDLLKSMYNLFKQEKTLRSASIIGALMFGAFSAFWTSLVFLLETPAYNMGAQAAGTFGLIGIAGILAAPVVGRIADSKGPSFALGLSIILTIFSYICFWIFGLNLFGLVIGIILLDLGTQSGQVSNQARIYAINPNARSRVNAVFMVCYFLGGACGSLLGSYGWALYQWYGVCVVGLSLLISALVVYFTYK